MASWPRRPSGSVADTHAVGHAHAALLDVDAVALEIERMVVAAGSARHFLHQVVQHARLHLQLVAVPARELWHA